LTRWLWQCDDAGRFTDTTSGRQGTSRQVHMCGRSHRHTGKQLTSSIELHVASNALGQYGARWTLKSARPRRTPPGCDYQHRYRRLPVRPSVSQPTGPDWRRQRNESIHHALMGKSNALVAAAAWYAPDSLEYITTGWPPTDSQAEEGKDGGSGQIGILTTSRRCTYTLARVKRLRYR